jgi:hypothetical protein
VQPCGDRGSNATIPGMECARYWCDGSATRTWRHLRMLSRIQTKCPQQRAPEQSCVAPLRSAKQRLNRICSLYLTLAGSASQAANLSTVNTHALEASK